MLLRCTLNKVFSIPSCLRSFRVYSSGNVTVSDFASRKKGTGGGSFIELPEFKPLQDSILVKIPSSSTVYGKLSEITAVSPDPKSKGEPFLAQDYDNSTGFTRLLTGQYPSNLIIASSTPMANIAVVKIDAGDNNGLHVPNFNENVLCYGGDLVLDRGNQVKGLGVVALAGRGPVYEVTLKKGEEMMVTEESILAYDSLVELKLTKLKSPFSLPKIVDNFFSKYFHNYYDKLLIKWDKLFMRDNLYCRIQGPGIFFLQTHFVPGLKRYSNAELMKTL